MSRVLGILALCLVAVSAAAQQQPPVPYTSLGAAGMPATIGTTSVQIAAPASTSPATSRRVLVVCNQSQTATVAITLGPNNTNPAVINGAGSYNIPPSGGGPIYCFGWSGGDTYVPADAVNAIASASGTPITIEAY